MTDTVTVTAAGLAVALDSFRLTIDSERDPAGERTGTVSDPEEVARVLFATLTRYAAMREADAPGDGHPELAAMRTVADALAPFEHESPGPVERILRWACDRWAVSVP